MGRVAGKVALVTGAASGLGLATAERLAAEGATVILTDINTEAGTKAAAAIGGNARFLAHDVGEEADWARVIADIEARDGALHILVNNAGLVLVADPETTTPEQFRFVNRVMSEGVYLGMRAALPLLARSGAGSIVNISSLAALQGYPVFFAYTAAKGAVRSMTKAVAVHCQDKGYKVRCNSVHPGGIETPLVQTAFGRPGEEQPVADGVLPYGSIGAPRDVADMVLYLGSDESRFITGAEFVIDNGASIR